MSKLLSIASIVMCFCLCHPGLILAQNSAQTDALKNNAYFHLQHQHYDEALAAARKLPAIYDKYMLMGLAYLQSDKLEESEEWLNEGISQFPDSLKLAVIKVEVLFFQERYPEMLQLLQATEEKAGMALTHDTGLEQLRLKAAYAYQKTARNSYEQKHYTRSARQYAKALQYEQSPEIYLGLCLSLLEQENWKELISRAREGLKKYPNQSDLSGLLANAYFKTGDYEALQQVYTGIYEADPQNIQKALTLGEVMMANSDFQEAQQHYDHLLQQFPENPEVYEAALQISMQYRNLESRVAILNRKNEHIPAIETVLQLAESYQLGKKWNEAIHLYDSLLAEHPDSVRFQMERVKAYKRNDSLSTIKTELAELIQSFPAEPLFAASYLKVLQTEECAQRQKALKNVNTQDTGDLLYLKAQLLWDCHKKEEARAFLLESIKKDVHKPEPYVMLATISSEEEALVYTEKAAFSLLKSIQSKEKLLNTLSLNNPFDPVWLDVPHTKELLDRQKEQLKEMIGLASKNFSLSATEALLNSLQEEFKRNALLMFLSGQHYAYHRQKEQAIGHYQKAIELEPALLQAQYEWARLNEKSAQMREAMMGYEKALAIDDEFEEAYDGLIRLYRKNGQLAQLADRWKMLYSNDKGNEVLKNALIEALHKQGKMEEAKAITQDNAANDLK